ncbi:MAG: outer membrane protein transport protein [Gammaproteobacteria bacterium]|nr:outer membrane protein transport protein [Gammaproteobacteria bacterium]
MSYPFRLSTALTLALYPLVTTPALAAGFQLSETSISGLGRSYAGEAAALGDAAVQARNSAALTQFKSVSLTSNLAYIYPEVDISGEVNSDLATIYNQLATAANGATGANLPLQQTRYSGNAQGIANDALIPSVFIALPINDRLALGFGSFAEFGLATDYPASSNTLEYGDKTELTAITFKPSLGWQLNEQWSIGAGLRAVYAEATLSTSTPAYFDSLAAAIGQYNPVAAATGALPQLPVVPANQPILHVSGDDWGYGYELGTVFTPSADLRLALSYRSDVALTLAGNATSALLPSANGPGSVDLTLPAMTELAARWQLSAPLALHVGALHTAWHSFDQLKVNFDNGTSLIAKEEEWQDAWRYAIGGDWQLDQQWQLRVGYANDQSPVPAHRRSLSIPDADRQWLSFGVGWQLDEHWQLDAGYAYLLGEKVAVQEAFSLPVNGQRQTISRFDGRVSKADAHLLGLSLSYRI